MSNLAVQRSKNSLFLLKEVVKKEENKWEVREEGT